MKRPRQLPVSPTHRTGPLPFGLQAAPAASIEVVEGGSARGCRDLIAEGATAAGQAAPRIRELPRCEPLAGGAVHLKRVACLIVTLPAQEVVILPMARRRDLIQWDRAEAIPAAQRRLDRKIVCK